MTHDDMEQDMNALLVQGPSMIATITDYHAALAWLGEWRPKRKAFEGWLAEILKPFKDAIKTNQDRFKRMVAPMEAKEKLYDEAIIEWRRKEEVQKRIDEAKALADYEKRMAKAEAKGQDTSIVAPPMLQDGLAKTTDLENGGSVTFVKIIKAHIQGHVEQNSDTRPKLHRHNDGLKTIPDQYWQLDWALVTAAIKQGIEIPGIVRKETEGSRVRS